jgi:hypothetical protein
MVNQKGKWKEIGLKAQRSKFLYFIWVIGKSYYQEWRIEKVWWEVNVLNLPKFLFSGFTGLVRWIHRLPETLKRDLECPTGLVWSARLVRSEDRLPEISYRLPEAFTGLVRWIGLVRSRTGFQKLSTSFQRGPLDLSDERFLQRLFWGGGYKLTPNCLLGPLATHENKNTL